MAVGRRGNEPSPSISPLDHAPCDKPSMAIGWKSRSDARNHGRMMLTRVISKLISMSVPISAKLDDSDSEECVKEPPAE